MRPFGCFVRFGPKRPCFGPKRRNKNHDSRRTSKKTIRKRAAVEKDTGRRRRATYLKLVAFVGLCFDPGLSAGEYLLSPAELDRRHDRDSVAGKPVIMTPAPTSSLPNGDFELRPSTLDSAFNDLGVQKVELARSNWTQKQGL